MICVFATGGYGGIKLMTCFINVSICGEMAELLYRCKLVKVMGVVGSW